MELNLPDHLANGIFKACLWILIGFPLLFFIARLTKRTISEKISPHAGMISSKIISYFGGALLVVSILLDFNFNLSAILGTAGIASVAFGFAAKTSLSNLISGIFLLWEKPFKIGDLIQVQKSSITGYVLSIDLLSVKIRTRDNLFVRIPNETLVSSDFTNISRFPIRRYTFSIGVSYDSDLAKVEKALLEVAFSNPFCLDDPQPSIWFNGLGDSSINYDLYLWFEQKNYTDLRNSLIQDIMRRFEQEGIEIPYTHYDLTIKNEPIATKKQGASASEKIN